MLCCDSFVNGKVVAIQGILWINSYFLFVCINTEYLQYDKYIVLHIFCGAFLLNKWSMVLFNNEFANYNKLRYKFYWWKIIWGIWLLCMNL